MKNSVQRESSDFQGLFRVKIRKMAQGSNDLSTLPLNAQVCHVKGEVRAFAVFEVLTKMGSWGTN